MGLNLTSFSFGKGKCRSVGQGRDAPAAEGLLAGGEPGAWSLVALFQSAQGERTEASC